MSISMVARMVCPKFARIAFALTLLASLPAGAVAATSYGRVRLNLAHRAPLPAGVEVRQIAAAGSQIWFGGLDHNREVPTPVVYRWSSAGVEALQLDQDAKDLSGLAASSVGEVAAVIDGRLWAAALNGDLRRVDRMKDIDVERVIGQHGFWVLAANRDLVHLKTASAPMEVRSTLEHPVTAWAVTGSGDLVFGTADGRLFRADLHGGKPVELTIEPAAMITAMHAAASGEIWIGHADGSLTRYIAGTVDRFPAGGKLPQSAITSISQDAWGNYYFASAQPDSDTATLTTQPRSLRSAYGTGFSRLVLEQSAGAVRTMATDEQNGTWLSVGKVGAFRLQGLGELGWARGSATTSVADKAAKMDALAGGASEPRASAPINGVTPFPNGRLTILNSAGGLVNDTVSCVVSDGHSMYFGTGYANQGDDPTQPGGGISKWDHREMTNITAGLPSLVVHACAYDNATGYVWFGTTAGLVRYNPPNGALTTFLAGAVVQDLLVSGGNLWVATFNSGVYNLNAATGAQITKLDVGGNKTTSLAMDDQGLWIGTNGNGLYRYANSTLSAQNSAIGAGALVQDLATDAAGNLWVAVWNNGLYRRTPAGVFANFRFGPAIGGNIFRTYRILRHTNGDLYFTHGFGGAASTPPAGLSYLPAAQVSSGSPQFQSFSMTNGLPTNTIFAAGTDGTAALWIGSSGGGAWRMGPAYKWESSLRAAPHHSSPLLVDLNNNGDLEIVVGDQSGYVSAFRPNGTLLWEYNTSAAVAPKTPGQMVVQSSPAAADVDGDGELEIVVGLNGQVLAGTSAGQGGVLILSRTGQLERMLYTYDITTMGSPGAPEDGLSEGVFATPVLANMDADPEPEIVVGAFDNMIYAWNADGTPIFSRDDDGDGRYDEDFLGDFTPYTPFNSADDAPGRKGVDDDGDGAIDEGHPSDDDEDGRVDEDYPEFPFNARDTVVSSALLLDLNNDGRREIIVGTDYAGGVGQEFARGGVLRVLDNEGKSVTGFPKGNLEQVIWSSPVAVDLDGDGTYEIAHGSGLDLGTVGDAPADQLVGQLVYAWKVNGTAFLGNSTGRFATTEGRSFASLAVGDLDNDGQPELVIATTSLHNKQGQYINAAGAPIAASQALGQKLYAFRANGTVVPGFPVRPNALIPGMHLVGSPVLADVDGNGALDIVLPAAQGLMIFDNQGRVLPGYGKFEALQDSVFGGEISTTPAVADIDGDGSLEVVWSIGAGSAGAGAVRAMTLGAANTALYTRSWPMWRRGVGRNGIFGPVISVVQGSESGGTLNIAAQAFVGRNALSSVTADLSSLGGPSALSLTASANAYYRGTHNVAAVAAGRYLIPITLTDTAGKTDTQTLFYVKRATVKQLSALPPTLAFGTVSQGSDLALQVNVLNIGNAAVTISSVTTSSAEFVIFPPITFPQVLQPGSAVLVTVRFRPGAAAGARTATLTVLSDDAVAPSRTVSLTGTTGTGGANCVASLTGAPTLAFQPSRQAGTFTLTTTPAGCAWTATSNSPWLQVYPISGNGQTTIQYTVFPNFSTRSRNAAVNFNGTLWNVSQFPSVGTADQRFVAAMYFAFFGRNGSTADVNFHVGTLPAIGRTGLAWNFMNSEEFNLAGRFIAGLYVGLLNRDAEYGGWLFQRNALAAGQVTGPQLVQNFLGSAEYASKFGSPSNDEFVRLLYRHVLLREPSAGEVAFQAGQISSGATSRANLANLFLNTPEFRNGTGARLTAFLLYGLLLQRDASPSELTDRMGRISDATSIRNNITEFLDSQEFASLLQ